ncbi:MAG TPA: hypothetical protein PKY59_12695 [Pyrinomonadaceae bacterium]|nr:hypothetical protein [Pyrinomonadaceae bacterium]
MNKKIKTAVCPACGKEHQVVYFSIEPVSIPLLKCPLITDLIYLNKVTVNRESRKIIKESLLGT